MKENMLVNVYNYRVQLLRVSGICPKHLISVSSVNNISVLSYVYKFLPAFDVPVTSASTQGVR